MVVGVSLKVVAGCWQAYGPFNSAAANTDDYRYSTAYVLSDLASNFKEPWWHPTKKLAWGLRGCSHGPVSQLAAKEFNLSHHIMKSMVNNMVPGLW